MYAKIRLGCKKKIRPAVRASGHIFARPFRFFGPTSHGLRHSSAAPLGSVAKMASSVGSEATTIGDNVGLVAAMIAVVVAQVLKPFSDWTVTGRFKAGLMVGSGGFPSSHSSLVTALATGAAYQSGLGDPAFATALVLALVVRTAVEPGRVPPRDERQHPSENQNPRSSRPLLRERRDGCDSGISLARRRGRFSFREKKTRFVPRVSPRRVRETRLTRQYYASSSPTHHR